MYSVIDLENQSLYIGSVTSYSFDNIKLESKLIDVVKIIP